VPVAEKRSESAPEETPQGGGYERRSKKGVSEQGGRQQAMISKKAARASILGKPSKTRRRTPIARAASKTLKKRRLIKEGNGDQGVQRIGVPQQFTHLQRVLARGKAQK